MSPTCNDINTIVTANDYNDNNANFRHGLDITWLLLLGFCLHPKVPKVVRKRLDGYNGGLNCS
jgi:hypothetical protein